MKKSANFILPLIILLALPLEGEAQDNVSVHVLTIGPGKHLFTRFGHTALMVEDWSSGKKTVYNFGEFRQKDPELLSKAITGKLNYYLKTNSFEKTVRGCKKKKRDLKIQTLRLTDSQAESILEDLRENAKPENRDYKYHHLANNCCTRVRDLLDKHTAGRLFDKARPAGQSYRHWIAESLKKSPIYMLGAMLVLGPEGDKPITAWEEQFYPEVFYQELKRIRLEDGKEFVSRERVKFENASEANIKDESTSHYGILMGVCAFMLILPAILMVFPRRPWAGRLAGAGLILWGLIAGVMGIFMVFLWSKTEHSFTHANENLLIFSPTHLLLVVPGAILLLKVRLLSRMSKMVRWYLVFSLVLVLADALLKVGPFIQSNTVFIAFGVALNVAFFLGITRMGTGRINE